jgi:hypothetical protein
MRPNPRQSLRNPGESISQAPYDPDFPTFLVIRAERAKNGAVLRKYEGGMELFSWSRV